MNKFHSVEENLGAPYADRTENLLEWLYQLRDRQREHQRRGAWLIKGRDLPWENNRQGKMKWFLHPALNNTSIRSMIVFEKVTRCSTACATTGKQRILSISRYARKVSWFSTLTLTHVARCGSSRQT
jgi:hypothetical protein